MEIINQKYYHIQRNPTWIAGDEYEFEENMNPFSEYIYKNGTNCEGRNINTGKGIFLNPINIADEILKVNKDGQEKDTLIKDYMDYDPYNVIKILKQTVIEFMKFSREEIFEAIRKEKFPEKPSRKNCIWLIEDNIDAVNYWWDKLNKNSQKLFEVEITGNIHIADQGYLALSSDPLNIIKEKAEEYWKSNKPETSTMNECVFTGKLKVISEKDIADFRKTPASTSVSLVNANKIT
ncbi:DUF2441 domain-containing protein [Flavobacterium collinsii]|uniref:DUF2441 domain-containing protein n=1 Tax=Flavobacterium collinsii TaxID=1114861 RepID=UPI00375809E4